MPETCVVVGGGVIGLSVAYELARRSWHVTVVDQYTMGRETSWAGAGIFPPANETTALHPLDRLRALSHRLHRHWADRLKRETGIDNGLRRCGGLYLARSAGEAAALSGIARTFREEEIECRRWTSAELAAREPALARLASDESLRAVYELPDEHQIRNPRHLQALESACRLLGVHILPHEEVQSFEMGNNRVAQIITTRDSLAADHYVVATGAWSQRLLAACGIRCGIYPVRGQMVLFHSPQPLMQRIVNEGPRYLVPRDDGHLLAGSTEEEVGFQKVTTPEAIHVLTQFATDLVPQLHGAIVKATWAGLRPASFDGLPYIGRMPGMANAYVAAGHFRSGLHLSTGTAELLAQLMCGETPTLDLWPFRLSRG